ARDAPVDGARPGPGPADGRRGGRAGAAPLLAPQGRAARGPARCRRLTQASGLRTAGFDTRLAVRGTRRIAGEDAIHRPPCLLEDGDGLSGLLVVRQPGDLLHGHGERHRALHEPLDPLARTVFGDLPGLPELLGMLLDVAPAL